MLPFPRGRELTLFRLTDCRYFTTRRWSALNALACRDRAGATPHAATPAASRDWSAASPDCDDDFFQARARELVGARGGGGVEEPAFDIGGRGGGIGAAVFHGDLQRLHLELAPRRGELGGAVDAAGDFEVEERI